MKSFLHTAILMCLSCIIAAGTNAQAQVQVPPALRGAVLQNFPLSLFCEQESARQNGDLSVPTSEQQVQQGCIRAYLAELSEGGPKVAVVIYPDECPPEEMLSPSGEVRIFRESDEGWVLVPGDGVPSQDGMYVSLDGVRFRDLDGDGRKEIVLRYFYPKATGHGMPTYDIFAWQLTAEGIRPMIGPPDIFSSDADYHLSFPLGEPPECRQSMSSNLGSLLSAPSPIVFRDLDDDGKLELILGPDQAWLPDPDPTCPPGACAPFPQDVTGTRILRLVDGVYQLVGETPVGVGLRPEMAAAMAPASIPQEMMLAHLDRGTEDTKEKESTMTEPSAVSEVPLPQAKNTRADRLDAQAAKITLYISPPQGYSLDQVDWNTLKVAGGALTPVADEGTHIAPNTVELPEAWIPWSQSGQVLYLEDLKDSDPGNFSCGDEDPVVFLAPGGRMHFSSAYRILRFDSSQVLTWLATQWRAGRMDRDGKSCFTWDLRDWCYTPIGLPFEVRLTTSIGPYPITAHGVAMLWVRN